MSFTVAIIGRPNVGKSTLFNRLVGKRLALVDDTPGVTRDRREGEGHLGPLSFRVIDTAGLEEGKGEALSARMRRQTDAALDEADLVLFMIDARAGVTPLDRHFADWVRRKDVPTVLLANKCEGKASESGLFEAFGLGLGDPIPVSAEHAEGMGELFDAIDAIVREKGLLGDEDPDGGGADQTADADETEVLQIAIVGRPNAGKSTLVNRLLGEERQITGPEAGLTRDSIALPWTWNGQAVRLFDTAGLRRKARVQEKLEKLSVADALRAVQFAHVVVILVDATLGFEKQDLSIADLVVREGRAPVIAVNKMDQVADRTAALQSVYDALERSLPQVRGVPVVPISALTGAGLERLMPAVKQVYETWNRRISTSVLNRWLEDVVAHHPPPSDKGRRVRIRYMSQIKTRPPTFVFFVNRPQALPTSYLRYLANELREDFELAGVPLRLLTRRGANPYA
ncbi:MAG: ribosome biogenesis GTPase Der [Alphaproteobacteria bacterium]|nr:MAG: ribosome biogenesis GTPase Der [Alphaproteobacteria bacterium]